MIAVASKNYPAIAANLAGHATRKCANAAGHAARKCVNTAGAASRVSRVAPRRVLFFALVLLLQDGLAKRVAPGYYYHLSQRFAEE